MCQMCVDQTLNTMDQTMKGDNGTNAAETDRMMNEPSGEGSNKPLSIGAPFQPRRSSSLTSILPPHHLPPFHPQESPAVYFATRNEGSFQMPSYSLPMPQQQAMLGGVNANANASNIANEWMQISESLYDEPSPQESFTTSNLQGMSNQGVSQGADDNLFFSSGLDRNSSDAFISRNIAVTEGLDRRRDMLATDMFNSKEELAQIVAADFSAGIPPVNLGQPMQQLNTAMGVSNAWKMPPVAPQQYAAAKGHPTYTTAHDATVHDKIQALGATALPVRKRRRVQADPMKNMLVTPLLLDFMSHQAETEEDDDADDGAPVASTSQSPAQAVASNSRVLPITRLEVIMLHSERTQEALQNWDANLGLPKSHSQTMVNTSRSRRQLQERRILPKWNGKPLIGVEGIAIYGKRRSDTQKHFW